MTYTLQPCPTCLHVPPCSPSNYWFIEWINLLMRLQPSWSNHWFISPTSKPWCIGGHTFKTLALGGTLKVHTITLPNRIPAFFPPDILLPMQRTIVIPSEGLYIYWLLRLYKNFIEKQLGKKPFLKNDLLKRPSK